MFETWEMTYKLGLDRSNKNNTNQEWISKGIELLKREKDKKTDRTFEQLARLFTIYQLYSEYQDKFKGKLGWYCEQYKCTVETFLKYIETYKNEFQAFVGEINSGDYEFIRKNKKIHFWMNSGTIKIATINSFKGWESELIFLILEKKSDFNNSFDELIYTGITRARSNLVIINFGNEEYDKKMKPLIDKVK
jgi:superfamily I DNA/RNA helicase